jgi:hypothetical protein
MAKHSWTKKELITVCVCYMENASIQKALELTGTKDEVSMDMRYRNCLFLHKGRIPGSLSHASKLHQQAWEDVQNVYSVVEKIREPEEEEEEVIEEKKVEQPDELFDRIVDYSIAIGMSACFIVAMFALFAH